MKEEKYKLLKQIHNSNEAVSMVDIVTHISSRKRFNELFTDKLIEEDPETPKRYRLTTKGREQLSEFERDNRQHILGIVATIVTIAGILIPIAISLISH